MSFSSSSSSSSSSFFFFGLHCDCRDKSSYLLQPRPKRCRLVSLGHKTTSFWPFYFFKSLPKTMSFGTKSLIQTTSFWISDLKQFQNNIVLDSDNPKRRPLASHPTTYGKFIMDKYIKEEITHRIFIHGSPGIQISYVSKNKSLIREN